jgi:hypothetical protein
MIEELKRRAAEHWQEWCPRRWASLVKAGILDEALTKAATQAEREIRQLMRGGARLDEAEEMVLPEWILLPPEKKGTLGSHHLDAEVQAMEDEHQRRERSIVQGSLWD